MSLMHRESWEEAFQILERTIEGEVRKDQLSRMLYSTDASIYQVEPYGVVLPKHEDDIVQTVKIADQFHLPIIPRAAGTSLAGQCVGHGIVLDISKYMNRLLVKNIDEEWAWVQPGLIQDELSRLVAEDGYHFGPDTSTSNRAMVGGMIGNNSCGAHSIYYGKTIDHTYEMEVILSDGSVAHFKDLTPEEVEKKKELNNLEGHIYRETTRIAEEYKDLIEEKFPKIMRRNTGYLLDELIRDDMPFNLSRLICGSEGTLAMITKAKMRLVPRPRMNCLVAAQFETLEESLVATVEAIKHDPCAVELMDRVILDLTKTNLETQRLRFFLEGDPDAVLAIEFYGDSKEELEAKMDALEEAFREKGVGYAFPRMWGDELKKVWALRKAGLGVLMAMPGDAKPATFVEDTAVPPERLPEYVHDFKKLMEKYETECTYYAHASVGELHLRPIVDLKTEEGLKKMVDISEEVADLVIKYGGSISGEHGDGRLRSPFHEKFFGPKLYKAMGEIKRAFDPKNIFNPNKIVDPLPMASDLRYPIGYKTYDIPTELSFEDQGGYLRALEFCNGAGACRKSFNAGGTMCPSYQATREETHSTRGRANTLRTAIRELGPKEAFKSEEVYKAMDLCLECKACKSECPSNVDMAKIKYEYLQKRHDAKGFSLADFTMGNIVLVNKLNQPFARLLNPLLKTRLGKWFSKVFLKVHPERSIPEFAPQTLMQWFKHHTPHPNHGKNGKEVYFFADPFINYNEPHIGQAAIYVLEGLGYKVELSAVTEDGRPLLSKGFMRAARRLAERNLSKLKFMVELGIPLIGVEPSTILTFRDEYKDFFPDDPMIDKIADSCLMIDEFLMQEAEEGRLRSPFKAREQEYLVHGHCFQKSLVGVTPTLKMLELIPGVKATEIPSGCCGMAGSFGYHVDKFDVSQKIAEHTLFPAVRARGEAKVLAVGTSCRHQLHDGLEYEAKHPIEILAEALPNEEIKLLPAQFDV